MQAENTCFETHQEHSEHAKAEVDPLLTYQYFTPCSASASNSGMLLHTNKAGAPLLCRSARLRYAALLGERRVSRVRDEALVVPAPVQAT